MQQEIHYRSDDGLSLFAKGYGDAQSDLTVLCMHGFTRNHKDFEPMISALDLPARFIAVDVRGRGKSDRDPNSENYTPVRYVKDMITLVRREQPKQLVLVGTSMGGLMAMMMAKPLRAILRGVILNDVGPEVEPAGLVRIAGYAGSASPSPNWTEAAENIARVQSSVFPDFEADDWLEFAKRTFVEKGGRIEPDYDLAIASVKPPDRPAFLQRFVMWRLFGALKQVPLLIIRGENSDILSAATASSMLKRHRGAQLITVPGRGHAPLLDEPVAVEAIGKFLARASAGG